MGPEVRNVGLERAGVMLSRRFASRKGDDIIIWSLLCGSGKAYNQPNSFWKSRLHTRFSSGFLMSTCERMKSVPGLSWAPATPFADPLAVRAHTTGTNVLAAPDVKVYWPDEGPNTISAQFLRAHNSDFNSAFCLRSRWFVHITTAAEVKQYSSTPNSCWERAQQVLSSGDYKGVIFLRPNLSQPLSGQMGIPFTPLQHLDDGKGAPVAVCATKDDREKFDPFRLATELTQDCELWGEAWEWKGVYPVAPHDSISASAFQEKELRLV